VVEETAIGGGAGREFPPTRWTLVAASREGTEERRAALAALLESYWKPLYFFVRRKGMTVEAAKDAVQGFYAHLLDRDFLERLDPGRGRFRGYLRAAMDHYLVNLHESASAQKRGGGARVVSLEIDVAERGLEGAAPSPAGAYDREWAAGVMERALGRLRREFEAGERGGPLEAALAYFRPAEPRPYAVSAAECRMSVVQFKAFLHRTRTRFRELVREEVAQTVADPAEVDSEMADLLRALGS